MREYRASKPSEQNNYLPQVNDEIPRCDTKVSQNCKQWTSLCM